MTIYAQVSTEKTTTTAGYGAELLTQLRRRRAALRLPPLPGSHRRDPLCPRERADGWSR